MVYQDNSYIPNLSIPFESAVHPQWEAANQAGYDWAVKMGLLQSDEARGRFKMALFGNLAGRCYPQAGYNELILANQYAIWLFMHDDHCDEARIGAQADNLLAYHHQIIHSIEHNNPVEDSPIFRSLHDIVRLTRELGGEALLKRFWTNHLDYFAGCQWEAANRECQYQPGVDAYMTGRDRASAVYACLDLGEIAYQTLDLPDAIRHSAAFAQATTLCNRVVSHVNDVFSFYKEYERGDMHNLVIAIKAEDNLTIPQAMDAAWSLETARYQPARVVPQGENLHYLENIL